jgi:hypothetical protein
MVLSARAVGGEAEVPSDTDHGTPFFLSYARAGEAGHSNKMAERFFFDLAENVGQLVSLRTGAEVGFMDTLVRGGRQWTDELLHALGVCQVLVPMLSAPYLASELCGKEWGAFSQRSVRRLPGTSASPDLGCIIPVIWAPVSGPLPSPVSERLIFAPGGRPNSGLPAEYRTNGVYGLMRMGQEDSYQIIVWQLAILIAKVFHSQRLEHRRFKLEDLRNAFRDERDG